MATLYAQSTGNWDAILWNTAANGSGTNETPAAADTLISNAFTVTVNGNYTVTKVTNTGGGTFTLTNGVTLTCTDATAGVVGDAASVGAVTFALTGAGESATLTSKIKGGNATNEWGVNFTGTKTLTINGNVLGGTGHGVIYNPSASIYISGAGSLIVNGLVMAGPYNYADAIYIYGAASVQITGNVSAGGNGSSSAASHGINIQAAAIITIYGDVVTDNNPQKGGYALNTGGACTISINGNCVTSSIGGTVLNFTSAAAVVASISGSVTAANEVAIVSAHASSVLSIGGECIPTTVASAITAAVGIVKVSGPLRAAANGKQALYCANWFWKAGATGMVMDVYQDASPITKKSLYSADVLPGMPAITDVKSGVTYGPVAELTGTYPGVVTPDAAYISAAVWDTLVADLDTANSIGARLAQAATVPSTGAQIAALGV